MPVTLTKSGAIAVVSIDNPPVNALNTAIRAQLLALVEATEADATISAVVLIGVGKLFVGGADITEFDRPPEQPDLPSVIARIERATKPWVAAIHGVALGGGLELALACHYRVAAPGATLGLPEVSLGFIPGAGGTQRLPRLIGPEAAIPVVAERQMLSTDAAARLGLLNRVIEADLRAGAVAFASEVAAMPLPQSLPARPLADPGAAFWDAARTRIDKAAKGQTAPHAALEAVRFGVENGATLGLQQERATFLHLRSTEESLALRHLFFAERAAPRPADLRGVEPAPLRLVGVVGGGTMGSGIAAALRNAGLQVILSEQDAAALDRGLASIHGLFDAAARRGLTSVAEAADRKAGVAGVVGLQGLADCDLVIEAVFEDLAVKRAVFAGLVETCRPDATLATNTSYIDPRKIAEGLAGPDRFLGLHFFSPAQVMKLLEIIPIPETSPQTRATGFDLARRMGKIPVQSGICEGFIGNRLLKRYRGAAEAMVAQGVAPAAIDAAMRGFGYPMGPFEMQDMAGLDISFMNREAARAKGEDVPETPADLLVRAGRKGIKAGGGWYDYAPGDRKPLPSAQAAQIIAPLVGAPCTLAPDAIAARLLGVMAAEGQAILAEGIANAPAAIDLVQVHGYGFPRTKGGPLFYASRKTPS